MIFKYRLTLFVSHSIIVKQAKQKHKSKIMNREKITQAVTMIKDFIAQSSDVPQKLMDLTHR